MAYNTGKPVPSRDPRDLIDNAESLDIRANSRTERSTPDRLGVPRKTWHGMECDFAEFMAGSSFELPAIPYNSAPIVIQRPTQLIERDGLLYSVAMPSSFPVSLSGDWAEDETILTVRSDQSLRAELTDSEDPELGSAMIGRSVVRLGSIVDMSSVRRSATLSYLVAGYHPGAFALANPQIAGGGVFHWAADVPKTAHDGGAVIDPDRIADFPIDWSVDGQKEAWFSAGSSGSGCFVRSVRSRVLLEEFGASPDIANNTQAIQAALDSGARVVTYVTRIPYTETVYMDTWGQSFVGPEHPGQYATGQQLQYNGEANTYAIHVRAPGCVVAMHNARGGDDRPNFVLFFRNQSMVPANADIDGYFERNVVVNFKEGVRFIGRSAWIRENLFSLHTTAIALQQFIFTSGAPEAWQTLERGYRGFEIIGNRFHGSSGSSILNTDTGHENLYGCMIANNVHDTEGWFMRGSISHAVVEANEIHRLNSAGWAFDLHTVKSVAFTGNNIAGEGGDPATASKAATAFKFNTRQVHNVNISGGTWDGIAAVPVQHTEPPIGGVSISGVTMRNVCWNAKNGAQILPIVDIANVSADGSGVDGYRFCNNILDLQPASGGATYGELVRFAVSGAANSNIDVWGNTFTNGNKLINHNLVTPYSSLFVKRAFTGNGAASQEFNLGINPEIVIVCPVSSGSANRGQSITVVRGTGAPNDLVQLTATGVSVKGSYNTSGVIYTMIAF